MTEVIHRRIPVDGVDTFVRLSGPPDAPVLVLPHGYPGSSYAYRHLLPALGHRWRLVAPDFPGSGFSSDPEDFDYTFDGFARWLAKLVDVVVGAERHAIWLHDFGSQIGLRYAIAHPERIAALVISNGDIYSDTLGPGYATLQTYWDHPTLGNLAPIQDAISLDGFRTEWLNDLPPDLAERVPPEAWALHWSLMTDRRRDITLRVIAGLRENRDWFERYQRYLRDHRPPTLILWGPRDHYMPEAAARAYLRDLPNAELHLLNAGHWVLEAQLQQCIDLLDDFLTRTFA